MLTPQSPARREASCTRDFCTRGLAGRARRASGRAAGGRPRGSGVPAGEGAAQSPAAGQVTALLEPLAARFHRRPRRVLGTAPGRPGRQACLRLPLHCRVPADPAPRVPGPDGRHPSPWTRPARPPALPQEGCGHHAWPRGEGKTPPVAPASPPPFPREMRRTQRTGAPTRPGSRSPLRRVPALISTGVPRPAAPARRGVTLTHRLRENPLFPASLTRRHPDAVPLPPAPRNGRLDFRRERTDPEPGAGAPSRRALTRLLHSNRDARRAPPSRVSAPNSTANQVGGGRRHPRTRDPARGACSRWGRRAEEPTAPAPGSPGLIVSLAATPGGAGCSLGPACCAPHCQPPRRAGSTQPRPRPRPGSAARTAPDGGAGKMEAGERPYLPAPRPPVPPPARGRAGHSPRRLLGRPAAPATAVARAGQPLRRRLPGAALPPERRRERPQLPRRALRD